VQSSKETVMFISVYLFFLANTAIAKLKCCHNLGDIVMVIMICGFYTLLEARESFRLRSKES
jgi:hypothetical protein